MPRRIAPLPSRSQVAESTTQEGSLTPRRTPRRLRGSRSSNPDGRSGSSRWWRRLWIGFLASLAIFLVIGMVAGYFLYEKGLQYYARAKTFDLKKLDDLNVTTTFYDVNGEELGRIFLEDRVVLKPEDIPPLMRQAALSAEDRRYYHHGAIDYWGILRAMRENLGRKARVQGGSTIEQQLAKYLIGDFSRTLDRKLLEAFVALRLEETLSKDQILNYYLNTIYFGKGYFGVGAAARGYFGKEAKDMTAGECALLAGMIRAPNILTPTNLHYDPALAKWRRNATLKQMLEEGYISREDYLHEVESALHVEPAKPSGLQSFIMAAAVKEMEQILSVEDLEQAPQGLIIRTNINLRLQRALEEQINLKLADIEKAGKVDPKNPLQVGALVAEPETGRILAWVGGRDFSKSQFDHISMAKREVGAVLQPMLYGLGFDRLNLNPASMINASYLEPTAQASPADLALGNAQNELGKLFLTVQDALTLGNRPAATRLSAQLGPKAITEWLNQAGVDQVKIPTNKPNAYSPETMTLGDVASVYQVLANNGIHRKLKLIRSITSRSESTLYEDLAADKPADQSALLNSLNAQQLTLTLQNALRAGPARSIARDYGFKSALAGMPGYSEGYRDAWFVGYTPKVLAGVWLGYDNSQAVGGKESALKSAVPLWAELMRQVEARLSGGGAFPVPSTLTKVSVDRSNGALRGLAGLAPEPGNIFVYLKKSQVDAIASAAGSNPSAPPPNQWSDWLSTMFQEADETGLSNDQVLGEDKRSNVIPALAEYKMPGLRGDILSTDGVTYATTTTEKNLVLGWPAADEATNDQDILRWMHSRLDDAQAILGSQIEVKDPDLINQYRNQRYQPFTVAENVTPDQASKIEAAGMLNRGFGFQTAPLRVYPRGPELAHVLGYLSRSQQRNRGKYLSGDVIYDRYKGAPGTGIEYVVDKDLAGKDGRFLISTTPEGYARSAAVAEPAEYGNNVRLTINSKFQAALEKALADSPKKIKAGVVMDVHTGDILAMASHPTYDPNVFLPAISADEWQLLNGDEFNPLLNRVIHGLYPPGSGFKTLTSIAAMNAGVFDPNWVVHCTGYFDLDNSHRMELKDEKGDVTFHDGLTYSYNTYFATLGEKIGRDILLDTARSFNFGNPTNIILPGEQAGLIPDPEFVRRVHGREFGYADIAFTSIGQGDVLVTPLQMVDFMAALANNGSVLRPRVISQIEDRHGGVVRTYPVETLRTVTLNDQWMPTLKEAMIAVIDEGTAKAVHRDDFQIAAKTGTAQVGSKDRRRQIAWLSGFFPADNPKYAFCVMVEGQFSDNRDNTLEGGLLGGRDAGAITKEFMDEAFPVPGDKKPSKKDAAKLAKAAAKNEDNAVPPTDDDSATPAPAKKTATPPRPDVAADGTDDDKPAKSTDSSN